jgi:hypothetical protein
MTVYTRKVESPVKIADGCALWKNPNTAEELVFGLWLPLIQAEASLHGCREYLFLLQRQFIFSSWEAISPMKAMVFEVSLRVEPQLVYVILAAVY